MGAVGNKPADYLTFHEPEYLGVGFATLTEARDTDDASGY